MLDETQILARTIYGEARGEYHKLTGGLSSLIAVGNVIMNRVKQQTWFGLTVPQVCQKPWQFSCWNKNDSNFKLLNSPVIIEPVFYVCLDAAMNLIKGQWPDLTRGADHYYAASLKKPPRWSIGKKPTCQIGNHIFFDLRK